MRRFAARERHWVSGFLKRNRPRNFGSFRGGGYRGVSVKGSATTWWMCSIDDVSNPVRARYFVSVFLQQCDHLAGFTKNGICLRSEPTEPLGVAPIRTFGFHPVEPIRGAEVLPKPFTYLCWDRPELVVHRLDRLGRSTRDVLNLVHELDVKGAALRVLEPEVTTAGEMGRMVITVLGMVADMELKFIRDRQRTGIEAAKDKGVYKGRRKSVGDDEIKRLASEGVAKAQIARELKVSRMTAYRALADAGTEAGVD